MGFHLPVYLSGQVSSTMDLAKEIVRTESPSGPFIAAARVQTSGRGRMGREWVSAAGQAQPSAFHEGWMTLKEAHAGLGQVLPLTLAIPRQSLKIPFSWVSVAAGCALYDAVEDLSVFVCSAFPQVGFVRLESPRRLFLKWPNDLIHCNLAGDGRGGIEGSLGPVRKLAGILVETSTVGGNWSWLFVGFGINLSGSPELPESPAPSAGLQAAPQVPGSLLEALAASKAPEMPKWLARWRDNDCHASLVCDRFLESLERELTEYLTHARTTGQLRSLALSRMLPLGTPLEVVEPDQSESPESDAGSSRVEFSGLADDASLLLSGRAPLYAGDVSLRVALSSSGNMQSRSEGGQRKPPPKRVRLPVSQKRPSSLKGSVSSLRSKSDGSSDVNSVTLGDARETAADFLPESGPGLLLVDVGNSRIHWAFSSNPEGELAYGHAQAVLASEKGGAAIPVGFPMRELLVMLAPVKRRELGLFLFSVREHDLSKSWLSMLGVAIEKAYPEVRLTRVFVDLPWLTGRDEALARVVRGYGNTLGIDRALRLCYLLNQSAETKKCVASLCLGTATTLEVVGEGGEGTPVLLESMIMPGLQASFDALHASTKALPREDLLDFDERDLSGTPGLSTRSSMARGVIRGTALACAASCLEWGVDKLWIAGGASAHFLSLNGKGPFEGLDVELEENMNLRALQVFLRNRLGPGRSLAALACSLVARAAGPVESQSLGQESQSIAQSLFKGRRHFRSLAASGELRDAPELGLEEGLGPVEMDPDSRDYRRLGPRLETRYIGERLDRHLGLRYRFHSREEWQERIARGDVLLEHRAPRAREFGIVTTLWKVKQTYRIKPFDQLWLFQPSEYEPGFVSSVSVLKDCGDGIAFHKPGNLVVHATGLYGKNTFLDVLATMGLGDVYPVHRIDRETSGILLCARRSETRRQLAELFRDGLVDKMYLAFARSYVEVPDSFVVDAPIGPAQESSIRLKMWVDERPYAPHAKTHFQKLAQVGNSCLFACYPETGRTNQIRVHLAAAGQWILGDKMYHPDEQIFLEYYENGLTPALLKLIEIPRQALHNSALGAQVPAGDIFADGPIVCPVSPDLMEHRIVRDLLEESRLGLSESSQMEGIRRYVLGKSELLAAKADQVLSLQDLRRSTEIALAQVKDSVRNNLN